MEIKVAFYRNGGLKKKKEKKRETYFHVLGNIFIWVEMAVWLEPVDKYQERDNLVVDLLTRIRNKLHFLLLFVVCCVQR